MADADYIEVEADAEGVKHVTTNTLDTRRDLMSILEAMTGNGPYRDEDAERVLAELIEKYHCVSCDGHSCDVP